MPLREELARFSAELTFDALPEDVVERTKLCLMDHICLMVGRSLTCSEGSSPDIPRFIKERGGREESTIVGLGGKIPCQNAVLVNTYVGSDTGMDSIHRGTVMHLSAALLPAALSAAEWRKASGRNLIASIVAGAEVMTRVGLALGTSSMYSRGFHVTSVCAPFGCAVATGKLLGLTQKELAEAIGIGAVQAAGSVVWGGGKYPTSWSFQIARAAESGVLAAALAGIGATGPEMIFEDQRGFLVGHSEKPDPQRLTQGLGKDYEIREVILKRYGVGVYNFTSIEAMEEILRKHRIAADDIKEITLELPRTAMPFVGFPEYPTDEAATRVSARYIMAVIAYLGTLTPFSLEFSSLDNRRNPGVTAMFERTNVTGNAELDRTFPRKKPCILTIKTKDGRRLMQRNEGPFRGEPENPLSQEEVETKFDVLSTPVLGQRKTELVKEAVRQLDSLDDASRLVELLTV